MVVNQLGRANLLRQFPIRICIVTPGAIGSNPRVVKEADALHESGGRVTVIATRTLARVDARDEALMERIAWGLERIDLRSRLVWRRLRLSQSVARAIFPFTGLRGLAERGFSACTAALTRVAVRTPADLYIAHYPAALPAAAAAARHHHALYAYDAEDFHLGDWPEQRCYDLDRRLVREIEGAYLPGCAFVTAASPGIADAYACAYGVARPAVILNVFPMDRAPVAPTPKGVARPGPSIYWFSQTIGPSRGLECAARAIGLARTKPNLYLRGSLVPGFAEILRSLAREAGAVDRLHFLPPAAPDDMERLASDYDVGLSSEALHSEARRLCLPNKLFTYIAGGVPPLMTATPAQITFAREVGLEGLVYPVDDASALADLLDRMLGRPEQLAAMRARVFRLAHLQLNWDVEKRKLCRIVHGLGLQ